MLWRKGWSKELLRHDQEAVLGPLEGPRGLGLGKAVHIRLGVIHPAIAHRPRERHQGSVGIALLLEVLVHGELVAHRVEPGARDDHRLRPAPDPVGHLPVEVLDHDLHFLPDRVLVEVHERPEEVARLVPVVVGVLGHLLEQPPVDLVGRVVLQDVEDEDLLDRLTHAVEAERFEPAVRPLDAEQLERLGLGGRREGEVGDVGEASPGLHLGDDLVLQVLPFLALFPLRLLQAPGRQHFLEMPRALARLRRVGLIDDDRELLLRQAPDLLGDHGELLERRHDDGLPRFQSLFELARGLVDVLHHAQGLLEGPDRALELAVQDAPVGDDDDRVEDPPVVGVVEHRELVGEPGDGVGLAAPGRMLDEVALAGPLLARVGHEPSHGVELVVAGEDQAPAAGLPPRLVLLLDLVDEVLDQVQDAVPSPDPVPQVGRRIPGLRRRHRGVPGTAELPLVEGEKAGLRPLEAGRHVHQVRVHSEVGQAPAESEERLPRVPVEPVLPDRILDGLPGEGVLQLGGEDRDAVEEDREVQALLLVLLTVAELAHHAEQVRLVALLEFFVQPRGRPEERQGELAPGIFDPPPEHVQRPPSLDLPGQAPEEALLHLGPVVLLEPLPLLGLGRPDEVQDVLRDQTERPVVVLQPPLLVAARQTLPIPSQRLYPGLPGTRQGALPGRRQGLLDRLLEAPLGHLRHRYLRLARPARQGPPAGHRLLNGLPAPTARAGGMRKARRSVTTSPRVCPSTRSRPLLTKASHCARLP